MSGMVRERIQGHLRLVLFGALLTAALPAVARADSVPKSVVELFTSQGCSSCPPADRLQGKFARRDDLIALTFNVDYWDYIGWKDTLAKPAYSDRQRAYARARGDGGVYTPQTVVDGIHHTTGSNEAAIERLVGFTRQKLRDQHVPIKVWSEGDVLMIKVGAAPNGKPAKPATIWLALVKDKVTVEIKRGENRGKTITYHRVVRDLKQVGRWTGQEKMVDFTKHHLMNSRSDGCVVLLQLDNAGPIIAAAELKHW
jgi:hypothetical protein